MPHPDYARYARCECRVWEPNSQGWFSTDLVMGTMTVNGSIISGVIPNPEEQRRYRKWWEDQREYDHQNN